MARVDVSGKKNEKEINLYFSFLIYKIGITVTKTHCFLEIDYKVYLE